tara:strand:+ start:863 stop:982 length:120 start_codon:yes stop_codon:yes gene_type:complete
MYLDVLDENLIKLTYDNDEKYVKRQINIMKIKPINILII